VVLLSVLFSKGLTNVWSSVGCGKSKYSSGFISNTFLMRVCFSSGVLACLTALRVLACSSSFFAVAESPSCLARSASWGEEGSRRRAKSLLYWGRVREVRKAEGSGART
jgi:hypothetical protein